MKKILFILGFLMSMTFSFGQDQSDSSIIKNNYVHELDVRIKSDPMSLKISTENLQSTESLQKTLNVVTYQNAKVNEELVKLNENLKNTTNNKISLLHKYDVNILEISRRNQLIEGTLHLCLGLLFVLFYIMNFNIRSNIYNEGSIVFKRMVLNMSLSILAFYSIVKAIFIFSSYKNYLFDILINLF